MKPGEADVFALWESKDRPYPWTAKQFESSQASAVQKVLVCEDDGAAVGFAVFQVIQTEAYLVNIMIEPAHRRKGYARGLLESVEMGASDRGATRLFLDVDPANSAAVSFYEKSGYVSYGRRRNAYPRGEDATTMKKILKGSSIE